MEEFIQHLFSANLENQSVLLLVVITFVGGIISSLSPCTIGMLPIIIGYVGGYSEETGIKTVIQVLCFVLGLSLVLTTLGVVAATAGKALGFQSNPVFIILLASFILVMGLNLLEVIEIPMPALVKEMPQNKNNNLILYPLILGGTFAIASTPCSTPILAGIMAYASLKANIALGGLLLFVYSLGQGCILILAGLFTSLFKKILFVRNYSGYFLKFSGVVMILAAFIIYFKIFDVI